MVLHIGHLCLFYTKANIQDTQNKIIYLQRHKPTGYLGYLNSLDKHKC